MKEILKKAFYVLAIVLGVGGIIAGFVACIIVKAYIPAVAVLIAGAMMFPTVKRFIEKVME